MHKTVLLLFTQYIGLLYNKREYLIIRAKTKIAKLLYLATGTRLR